MNDRKKSNVLWLRKEELKQARQCLERIEPFFERGSLENKYNCYTQIQEEISKLRESSQPTKQSLIKEQVQILQNVNDTQQSINSLSNEEEKKQLEEKLNLYQSRLNDIKKTLGDLDLTDNNFKIVIDMVGVLQKNLGSEQPLGIADLKNIFQTLKQILYQEKEASRPRTYCHTGIIVEKLRDNLSKNSKHPGDEFFRLTLENKVVFYAFQHELDNKEDYQNKVVPLATGEKWELEGHRWVADKYYLRKLTKIES